MQKFSKTLFTVLGIVALVAFIGLAIYNIIEINQLHAVANANRSAQFHNPRNLILIGYAVGLLAGLLLGLAWAMPSKSFKARYADQRKAESIADASAAGYHGASGVTKESFQSDSELDNS